MQPPLTSSRSLCMPSSMLILTEYMNQVLSILTFLHNTRAHTNSGTARIPVLTPSLKTLTSCRSLCMPSSVLTLHNQHRLCHACLFITPPPRSPAAATSTSRSPSVTDWQNTHQLPQLVYALLHAETAQRVHPSPDVCVLTQKALQEEQSSNDSWLARAPAAQNTSRVRLSLGLLVAWAVVCAASR